MPEAQTVQKCADLREDCRGKIFDHIDEKHDAVMGKLADIEETLAYQKGQANGEARAKQETAAHEPVTGGDILPWSAVAKIAVIAAALGGGISGGCMALRHPIAAAPVVTAVGGDQP